MSTKNQPSSDKKTDKFMDWVLVGTMSVVACAILWHFHGPVYGIPCGLITLGLCYSSIIKRKYP